MASDIKTIRNTLGVPQSVVFQGRQITLQPYAEEPMDTVLADVFLARCAPVVEEVVKDDSALAYDPDAEDSIWIANVTGNPAYPKEIDSKMLQAKKWVNTKTRNPAAFPHPVEREYDEGQLAYTGRDGAYMTKNLPKVPLVLAPFQRKQFLKKHGEWFLRREGNSVRLSGFSPSCIRSRKPVAYEPDMSWNLDELRAYLKVISGAKEFTGPSEHEMAKARVEGKWSKEKTADELHNAKQKLVKDAWYFVVDPRYRQPTKQEIRELMTGKSTVAIVDEQVEKLMGNTISATA